MKNLLGKLFLTVLGISLISGVVLAGGDAPKRAKRADRPVQIKIVPVGPTQEMVDKARSDVERSGVVQKELSGVMYRLIDISYLDNNQKNRSGDLVLASRYRAVFYDYTNDRVFVAEGSFDGSRPVTIHQEFYQPIPSEEEYDAAVRVLQQNQIFAEALKKELLKPFRPMPPVTVLDGTTERILNIGLSAQGASVQNEIVGVSLKRNAVIRYTNNAPPTSKAAPEACGPPFGGSSTFGAAGQYQLTVTQGQTTLWEMLVIRPAASGGTVGSGIEVQNVKYKGKSVLKRGHVPVLNVQYVNNVCGPYRDWQNLETSFNAPDDGSTDPAPGIKMLGAGQVATTIIESGIDSGNFIGVAIYTQNDETVMVSEMAAGWYRYIMEWRFNNNGTIRPRFGFGATSDNCVCNVHNHHVYWRLDFDIVNTSNKVYQVERGRRFLQPITTEINTNKNLQTNRSVMIQNSTGDEAYMLVPNISDGIADTFGVNDIWALQYKTGATPVASEIDDGRRCCSAAAEFLGNNWVNGESLVDQDIVVWYAAHFIHADGANLLNPDRSGLIISGSHVVGPDIYPVRW